MKREPEPDKTPLVYYALIQMEQDYYRPLKTIAETNQERLKREAKLINRPMRSKYYKRA